MLSGIRALSRPLKRAVMLAADAASIPIALWLAFVIKFDSLPDGLESSLWLYVAATAVSLVLFWAFGLYRSVVRYIGPQAMVAVVAGVVGSAIAVYSIGQTLTQYPIGLSTTAIYSLIALVWVGSSRYVARWMLLQSNSSNESVAVYGAGEAGVRLARALNVGKGLSVVAFIDDKKVLRGSMIDGISIFSPMELQHLVQSHGISRVLLAVPTASRRRRAEIIRQIEGEGVLVQTIPNLAEIVSGHAQVDELREIDVSDLLGRDPVPPNLKLLDACIRNKNVMVTGAGGSIGSELCRHLHRFAPESLVMLDRDESALQSLQLSIEGRSLLDSRELVVACIRDRDRLAEVFDEHRPEVVFHAAALKHLSLLEMHPEEGWKTNVVGTANVLDMAVKHGVDHFVNISTDKAAEPTSVLGRTKRLAEQLTAEAAGRSDGLYISVRFGNVLGSRGSVLPLFRNQIDQGGPVTVTDPDVTRFFMTIPEACELVIQAGASGVDGEVMVLDMGEAVRIVELAERLIAESGKQVEIVYTGLRPGEKLAERLFAPDEEPQPSAHPLISRVSVPPVPAGVIDAAHGMDVDQVDVRDRGRSLTPMDQRSA